MSPVSDAAVGLNRVWWSCRGWVEGFRASGLDEVDDSWRAMPVMHAYSAALENSWPDIPVRSLLYRLSYHNLKVSPKSNCPPTGRPHDDRKVGHHGFWIGIVALLSLASLTFIIQWNLFAVVCCVSTTQCDVFTANKQRDWSACRTNGLRLGLSTQLTSS